MELDKKDNGDWEIPLPIPMNEEHVDAFLEDVCDMILEDNEIDGDEKD